MAKSKNIYGLPIKKEDFDVAVSDPRAHHDHYKESIDFPLPEGTDILAAADGNVTSYKDDSNQGGNDRKYIGRANFVTLQHENDELTQYLHLKYKGITRKVGDVVKRGEVIGYSGNTGYSTEPHLHFMVIRKNDTEIGWETLEPQFEEKIEVLRNPKKTGSNNV